MNEKRKSGGSAVRTVTPMIPLAIALLHTAVLPSASPPNLSEVVPVVCGESVEDYMACHTEYPTGCNSTGKYDAYLNEFKNQVEWKDSTLQRWFTSQAEITELEGKLPDGLGKSNHGDFFNQLAALGEGQIYGLVGYLYSAKAEGKESSNCQLEAGTDDENVDYHIYIGFDPALADRLLNDKATPADKRTMNAKSMIVEMTPHYRARFHPEWTLAALQKQIGKQVKITGQLIVDNEHYQPSQDCGLPNHTSSCWRLTVWELHPVTDFEICESGSCDQDSTKWSPLADTADASDDTNS
ncbi:MAG TPA: hypothetical protein VEI01_08065 [Terriglobales bacterium]|nr:hypothetical protein [Terriglobales bacterium]